MDGSGSFHSLLQENQNNHTAAKTSSLCHAPTIITNVHRSMQGIITSISGLSQQKNVTKEQEYMSFLDQCPVHPQDVGNLRSAQMEFLATNTSVLQPTNQNIIRTLKQKFCRSFLLILLRGLKSNEHSQKFSLLETVKMLHQHGAIAQETNAIVQKLHSVQKQLQWTKLLQRWWWWWWL